MDASESLESTAKPLTLASPPSIRAALAAGAIPPPLFFGRRRVPPERIGLVAHRLRIDVAAAFSRTRKIQQHRSGG
jgi:hypothetical protein